MQHNVGDVKLRIDVAYGFFKAKFKENKKRFTTSLLAVKSWRAEGIVHM